MENNNIFSDWQICFRSGKARMIGLVKLLIVIFRQFAQNILLHALFLDISSVFDNMNLNIFLEKCLRFGLLDGFSNNLIKLFTNRNTFIRKGNKLILLMITAWIYQKTNHNNVFLPWIERWLSVTNFFFQKRIESFSGKVSHGHFLLDIDYESTKS